MPLHPRVRLIQRVMNVLDRKAEARPIVEVRRASAMLSQFFRWMVMDSGPTMHTETDLSVPVANGAIVVRIYRPSQTPNAPLHVFLHGGGWCIGTLYERDPRCRAIASGANCVVASVDYRMAPENQYPTAPEDCFAALVWLIDNAEELGIDATRISISGESAGANLAAVLCLMTRDRGGPSINYQWLDVPATDLTLSQPSLHEVPDGHGLDLAAIHTYLDAYLHDRRRAEEAYASPLLAEDLAGLPPAWIMSAEFDKLRDDGTAYASALSEAGIAVHQETLAGHVHASFAFVRLIPESRSYQERAIAALAQAIHP